MRKTADAHLRYSHYDGRLTICRVEIYHNERRAVVVLTNLRENRGPSIAEASELLATQVARRYHLPPAGTIWIEHFPEIARRGCIWQRESYAQVCYTWAHGEPLGPRAMEPERTTRERPWLSALLCEPGRPLKTSEESHAISDPS